MRRAKLRWLMPLAILLAGCGGGSAAREVVLWQFSPVERAV